MRSATCVKISSFSKAPSANLKLNLFSAHSGFYPRSLRFIVGLNIGPLVLGYVQGPFGRLHGAEVKAPRVTEKRTACQNPRDFLDYFGAVRSAEAVHVLSTTETDAMQIPATVNKLTLAEKGRKSTKHRTAPEDTPACCFPST